MTCTKTTHAVCKKTHDEEVLNKVHDFLGVLIRENLIKEAPYLDEEPLLKVSDLADDLWDVIHKGDLCNMKLGTDSHRHGNEHKPMTLDEAIAHAEESVNDTPCGQEHRQLADWLKELRKIKNTNAAKMLEALKNIKEEAETTCEYMDYPIAGLPGERGTCPVVSSDWIIEECSAALSAPARNCDRFSNNEQAWDAYCEYMSDSNVMFLDYEEWLFSEAKGDNK
jgi:hypothetical protein